MRFSQSEVVLHSNLQNVGEGRKQRMFSRMVSEYGPWTKLFDTVQVKEPFLSHNNPCFPCNIAVTNFLVLNTCEI